VSHPVRRGSIVDLGGAMHLLERLLHGRSDLAARPGVVVLTVPALCTPADRTIAITAAEALEPRTVLTIDSVKAAAIGAKADFDRPLLVVDLGAHLTEVALLYDGAVVAASCAALGTNDLAADITTGDLVVSVLDMVTGLLHSDCAPQVVDALDAGPVLAGGGSLLPAIVYQLAKRLSSPVRPAPMPHTAAIRGAGQVTQSANRHPST
jgi:rod shape-determining protein MreB